MDWILIGTIAVAGWAMLSVLMGERSLKVQSIAAVLTQKVKQEEEIPVAHASQVVAPLGGGVRKAA